MSNRDGSAFPLSSNCKRTAGFFACLCCLIMLTLPGRSQAQTVTDIYDFVEGVQGYGNYPGAPLIVGPNGVLYGTTDEGGNINCDHQRGFGCGTIYQLAPSGGQWNYSTLYEFNDGEDGAFDNQTLTMDGEGNLYGATTRGTPDGAIYQLTPGSPGNFSIIYQFTGMNDGAWALAPLFIDSTGSIYGATRTGAKKERGCDPQYGCGAIFQLVPPAQPGGSWTEQTLYDFAGKKFGGNPNLLVMTGNGIIYGATYNGGTINPSCHTGCGVIFQLIQQNGAWTYSVIHRFNGKPDYNPYGALVQDASGALYGLAVRTGGGVDIFRLVPQTGGKWKYSVIYSYTPGFGATSLIVGADGNLYGDIYGDQDSDGGYVFAWIFGSSPNKIAMQKLDASGLRQWGTNPIFISGTGTENLTYASIVRSDNGNVILMMSGYSGSFLNPQNYRLYTQKYSPAGSPLWGANPDTVYALGRVPGFYVPELIPDGNNGAFYVWQDDRNSENTYYAYVQHVTANDTKMFPVNGSPGSTLPGRLHIDASACYTPLTGETYLFWYETDALFQSSYGVYGQKFSANGTPQWADSGKAFRPFGGGQPSFIHCFAKDSSAVAFYFDGVTVTTNLVRGFKVDRNGTLQWGGVIKNISSVSSGKGRLNGVFLGSGTSLLTWADERVDDNGIYAQNVNFDGTLGIVTDVGTPNPASPSSYSLSQNYPNPFNPSTTIAFTIPEGAHGRTSLRVYDVLGREIATLVNEELQPGTHMARLDASTLTSGVYFYRLTSGSFSATRKLMMLK